MKNEGFDPKMEIWKIFLAFLKDTADGVRKQGVALSLALLGACAIYLLMEDRIRELRNELVAAKADWSEALNIERKETLQIKDALDQCNTERERLAVQVAALQAQFVIFKQKR